VHKSRTVTSHFEKGCSACDGVSNRMQKIDDSIAPRNGPLLFGGGDKNEDKKVDKREEELEEREQETWPNTAQTMKGSVSENLKGCHSEEEKKKEYCLKIAPCALELTIGLRSGWKRM
jgi:hypothetical protein